MLSNAAGARSSRVEAAEAGQLPRAARVDTVDARTTPMENLADNIWLLSYPLNLLGMDIRRNTTVLRLAHSRVLIHSTAPFTEREVIAIRELGQPAWLVEAMLRHDTYTQDGLTAFPGVPYLAPEGFAEVVKYPTEPLLPPPAEWAGQVEVLELEGVPSMRETVLLHKPSRTLIVADLAMNFPADQPAWQELLLKIAVGKHHAGYLAIVSRDGGGRGGTEGLDRADDAVGL